MLKISKLLFVVVLFAGCIFINNEPNLVKIEPPVKQYLDLFIRDNEKLNPESNVIIILCNALRTDQYILDIMSEMEDNTHYSFKDIEDSVYYGCYNSFKLFIFDDNQKVLKNRSNSIYSVKNECSDEIIPISYNGAFWRIKISDGEIIDFSYQFCEPDDKILEQLKSIPIPPNW